METDKNSTEEAKPKKMGRPKGSKNKPKDPTLTPKTPKKKTTDSHTPIHHPGRFVKGDPRIQPGPGRTRGYTSFMAETMAGLFDSSVSVRDKTPFIQAATDKMKKMILAGNPAAMKIFMDRVALNPNLIDKLDDVLAGQKNKDVKFLNYQLFDRCFDEQQKVLMTKQPTSILVCGRRAGKTEALAVKIVQTAISHEQGDVIYIGKTYTSAYEIIWKRITDLLDDINIPYTALLSEQTITLGTGVNIYVRGAHTIPDIDKLRGHKYRLSVIDEIQSIKHLRMLMNEILRPAMADYAGSQMLLAGTPPRTKGTYVEAIWESTSKYVSKFHWDLTSNPNIPNNQNVLTQVREEQGYAEDNPVYQREWLGKMGVYDVDALVYAPTVKNALNEEELRLWVESQRPQDLFFSAGLDLGWVDSDAFVIILGSSKRPEKWLIYEHKRNKQLISQLVHEIHVGYDFVRSHTVLRNIPGLEHMIIWCDAGGGGKKIAQELRQQFGLNTADAIKTEKSMAIDLLREEIRMGRFKFNLEGSWADECDKVIYLRDDNDQLTSQIDDDYHPDLQDSILYSLRPIWRSTDVKIGDKDESRESKTNTEWAAIVARREAEAFNAGQPHRDPDPLDEAYGFFNEFEE